MVLEVEAARAQVERIFQSKAFRNSDVLRHLLSYLVDASLSGTADDLKEYTVAVDALGKPSSYDPRQESAVRMQVGRLRQKLAEYYRGEGAEDTVVLDLPKGGFKVVFEPRKAPFEEVPLPEPVPDEVPTTGWRRREVLLVAALVLSLAAGAFFATRFWQVKKSATAPPVEVDPGNSGALGTDSVFEQAAGCLYRHTTFSAHTRVRYCARVLGERLGGRGEIEGHHGV